MNNEVFEVIEIEKGSFLIFKRLFLLKNELFEVLKTEKGSFLILKDFFGE